MTLINANQRGGSIRGPVDLVTVAQDFTAAWADLGNEIQTDGIGTITNWLTLDINGSTNARIRLVGRHTSGGNDYPLPTYTVGAVTLIEHTYMEFNQDIDQLMPLFWYLAGSFPFVQFQIQAGVVGAPAAQIDNAVITTVAEGA